MTVPLFAAINRNTLELTIAKTAPHGRTVIPLKHGTLTPGTYADEVSRRVLYEVLYPARYRRQQRGRVKKKAAVKFALAPPDPWLVTLGAVMWQGIVGGASWDTVKLAVLAALSMLREARAAPPGGSISKEVNLRLGFHWTEYAEGRKLRDLFVGLERSYRKQQSDVPKKKSHPRRGVKIRTAATTLSASAKRSRGVNKT